jgi:hypothetical protein
MKKYFLFLAMGALLALSANGQTDVWDGTHTPWTNGNGTQASPYLIETAEQLAHLAYTVNNGIGAGSGRIVGTDTYWKLTTDIDLNGSPSLRWVTIGYERSASDYYFFGGNFDGNGKTISNLFATGYGYMGLFGYIDGGSIKNVGIVADTVVSSSYYSGGIAGYCQNSTITNCYNTGNVSSHSSYSSSGGIAGYCQNSTIANCYNTGSVSSSYYSSSSGVILGEGDNSTINNCYYLVTVPGNNTYGGVSKTDVFMKSAEFVSLLNSGENANFAFSQDMAPFANNGYPVLRNHGFSIQTLPTAHINRDNAMLNGYIHPGTVAISTKGFQYKSATETAYTSVIVGSTNDTLHYNLTGLQPSTTYQFRTFATNTSNDSAFGNILSFTTPDFNTDSNGYYLIENIDDLILLAHLVNGGNTFSGQTFLLANDITLPNTPNNIISIGNYQNNRPFSGIFIGNGKRIYNVYIDEPNTPYQGFFGYTLNAHLYEVGLVNITASGRNYTGGMVAYAGNTRINDSYVSGGTLFALSYCGGLVGYQTPGDNSIISGCYNTCTVTGNNYVGGLVGYSDRATVRNSYAAALVSAQGSAVGAIIGGAQDVLNYNCYFNDSITGQAFAIGENNISNSITQKAQTGTTDSEGNMSSAAMRMQAFVNTLNQGLSLPVWKMDGNPPINNGFPILIWQTASTTGITETVYSLPVQIYPNPVTNGQFTLSGEQFQAGNKAEIYTVQGVRVGSYSLTDKETSIDISHLASGVYFVKVGSTTRKLIVNK